MKLLLDTHTVIFSIDHREKLSPTITAALLDPENERWVSTISIWEIAIKIRIGKLEMPTDAAYYHRHLEQLRAKVLPVNLTHSLQMMHLPLHHRDPFDRLLVAQAQVEGLTLATRDPRLANYGIETLW